MPEAACLFSWGRKIDMLNWKYLMHRVEYIVQRLSYTYFPSSSIMIRHNDIPSWTKNYNTSGYPYNNLQCQIPKCTSLYPIILLITGITSLECWGRPLHVTNTKPGPGPGPAILGWYFIARGVAPPLIILCDCAKIDPLHEFVPFVL